MTRRASFVNIPHVLIGADLHEVSLAVEKSEIQFHFEQFSFGASQSGSARFRRIETIRHLVAYDKALVYSQMGVDNTLSILPGRDVRH